MCCRRVVDPDLVLPKLHSFFFFCCCY